MRRIDVIRTSPGGRDKFVVLSKHPFHQYGKASNVSELSALMDRTASDLWRFGIGADFHPFRRQGEAEMIGKGRTKKLHKLVELRLGPRPIDRPRSRSFGLGLRKLKA